MNEPRTPDEQFPATWYRIHNYGEKIRPETVHKVTPQFVYIKYYGTDTRLSRVYRDDFYPTWDEAMVALVARRESDIASLQRRLHGLQSELEQIKSLRKPE